VPESSFFEPIGMAFPKEGGNPAKPKVSPAFSAGYRNIYGTNVKGSFTPGVNEASLNAQVPIGDHQKQFFLTGGAYMRPSSGGAPSDYGFRLGFKKNIEPQGIPAGQAVTEALRRELGPINESGETINASTRSNLLESFTPEQLKMLSDSAKRINREEKDRQLGITTGAEKYGFDFGVDVKQPQPVPENIPFLRDYANQLPQPGLGI